MSWYVSRPIPSKLQMPMSGNIKPGETGNLDTMVSGVAPTEDDGKVKIIITYEDENGLTTEVEKEMLLL